MHVSRRTFIQTAAAGAAPWPIAFHARQTSQAPAGRLFLHGVASGDPLADRVILWTRVTPPAARSATGPIDVRWRVASDERLTQVVASGTAQAVAARDFTVKVDAGNLRAGATYYYAFDTGGEQSPIGRTKTLPGRGAARLRLAQVSCSNYPTGYFNVYRCLANRPDLDAVLHLGDYIYEYPPGQYSDPSLDRRVEPPRELVALTDYRARYSLYRRDIDLQEVHRLHPFIVVWDDHESANDAWSGGAQNHNRGEGDWHQRQRDAYRAYLEWMPVRESAGPGIRLYRQFRLGDLADLIMLDTRGLRDRQVRGNDRTALADARRTLLGSAQETWLAEALRQSQRAGTPWRLLGQQIVFSTLTLPGAPVDNPDIWDGYQAARERIFDMLARDEIRDLAILSGDIHSSWAFDVTRRPWPTAGTGRAPDPVGVELVAPAISSPPLFATRALKDTMMTFQPQAPHLKYLEGDSRGYVLLDITARRLQAEWYFVPTVTRRTDVESRGTALVCERGAGRLG
jgi:alkaline phosphatase D